MADPGEGAPLFLDQTKAQMAEKIFLESAPPPPYLKVWIRHCSKEEERGKNHT